MQSMLSDGLESFQAMRSVLSPFFLEYESNTQLSYLIYLEQGPKPQLNSSEKEIPHLLVRLEQSENRVYVALYIDGKHHGPLNAYDFSKLIIPNSLELRRFQEEVGSLLAMMTERKQVIDKRRVNKLSELVHELLDSCDITGMDLQLFKTELGGYPSESSARADANRSLIRLNPREMFVIVVVYRNHKIAFRSPEFNFTNLRDHKEPDIQNFERCLQQGYEILTGQENSNPVSGYGY